MRPFAGITGPLADFGIVSLSYFQGPWPRLTNRFFLRAAACSDHFQGPWFGSTVASYQLGFRKWGSYPGSMTFTDEAL